MLVGQKIDGSSYRLVVTPLSYLVGLWYLRFLKGEVSLQSMQRTLVCTYPSPLP
jgi:hypothetical protein